MLAPLWALSSFTCQAQAASPPAIAVTDVLFDQLVQNARLPVAGVVVFDARGGVYERFSQGFEVMTAVPVASASKWVAAALIMTAVDRRELSLDDQVGRLIPEAPLALRPATLRQLLSHTAGVTGRPLNDLGTVSSLEDSVHRLMAEPMARAPGSAFAYGGVSFQIAGLMLERAAKRPFEALFAERLAGPLGMRTARFGSPSSWGTGAVPWVAGGMTMSIDDYRRFLTMMLDDGMAGGKRILSRRSIAAIENNAIQGVRIAFKPAAAGDAAVYGLGVWCEDVAPDGRCGLVSSAGAFGTYPWIDRRRGRAGVFVTRSALPKVLAGVTALREAATAIPTRVAP